MENFINLWEETLLTCFFPSPFALSRITDGTLSSIREWGSCEVWNQGSIKRPSHPQGAKNSADNPFHRSNLEPSIQLITF